MMDKLIGALKRLSARGYNNVSVEMFADGTWVLRSDEEDFHCATFAELTSAINEWLMPTEGEEASIKVDISMLQRLRNLLPEEARSGLDRVLEPWTPVNWG